MIRKLLLAAALALSLGGCAPGTVISGATVVAEIKQICGIIVTEADIAALVSANPLFVTADLVAHAVCDAFKAQQSANPTAPASGGTIVVNGVIIHYTIK